MDDKDNSSAAAAAPRPDDQASPDATLAGCPFCGGESEMDTRRAYRNISTGQFGDAVAIYCLGCSADMNACREDYSGLSDEDLIHMVSEMWNRRSSPTRDATIEECAKVAESYADYSDRNRGISPETQALIIRDAIRALSSPPVSGREGDNSSTAGAVPLLPEAESVDCSRREAKDDYKIVAIYHDPQDAAAVLAALRREAM